MQQEGGIYRLVNRGWGNKGSWEMGDGEKVDRQLMGKKGGVVYSPKLQHISKTKTDRPEKKTGHCFELWYSLTPCAV